MSNSKLKVTSVSDVDVERVGGGEGRKHKEKKDFILPFIFFLTFHKYVLKDLRMSGNGG